MLSSPHSKTDTVSHYSSRMPRGKKKKFNLYVRVRHTNIHFQTAARKNTAKPTV